MPSILKLKTINIGILKNTDKNVSKEETVFYQQLININLICS